MPTVLRTFRWLIFAAFLAVLGWSIYTVLPPQPRWTVEGDILAERFLPDDGGVVLFEDADWRTHSYQLTVRDRATGKIRSSDQKLTSPVLTHDLRRGLCSRAENQLTGFNLVTGKEWTQLFERNPMASQIRFSEEDDVVALHFRDSTYLIDMDTGKILAHIEHHGHSLPPRVFVRPGYILVHRTDSELFVLDRLRGIAKSIPVRAIDVKLSENGRWLLVQEAKKSSVSLFEFPSMAEHTELGKGSGDFSRNGKYLAFWNLQDSLFDPPAMSIAVWDLAARQRVMTLKNHHAGISIQ